MTDITDRDIAAEVDRRLRFWALWRAVGDDPGIGYPRTNILGRYYRPPAGDVWDGVAPVDWSEAEDTDEAVRALRCISPPCFDAVMAKYFHWPDRPASRKLVQEEELRRYPGKISGTRFRELIAQAKRLVAMRVCDGAVLSRIAA